MAELKAALEVARFAGVQTIAASGNVLLESRLAPGAISQTIARLLQAEFGIECIAAVLTRVELEAVLAKCPFADGEPKKVHVLFCDGAVRKEAVAQLRAEHAARGAERIEAGDGVLYVDYVDGVGDSKLTNAWIERRLGCSTTARNVNSLQRILGKMN